MEPAKKIKTIKIFAFLVCLFGFWSLSFGFPQFASAGWTSGKYGSAISFNGTSNYVSSNTALPAASAFSYSLWFKSSDGAYAANEYLFSQGTNDPSVYIGATNGKINLMADNALKITSNKTFLDAGWHHLEITADGANLKLYLDGILESSAAYAGSSAAGLLYVASNATPGSYFGGIIDDVKVYAYARTQDEIFVDYNAGKAAHLGKNNQRDDGLVGYWNMEEGKGQTVYDRSGNSNNGILGGTTAVQKSDPVFTSGYSSAGAGGTGLKFDGKDDYVNAGSPVNLDITNAITVEAWVKADKTFSNMGIADRQYSLAAGSWSLFLGSNEAVFSTATLSSRIRTSTSFTNYTNQWHHIVGTFSLSEQLQKIYIDGVLKIQEARTTALQIPTVSLKIGTMTNGGINGNYFSGTIDEVRIYNRALSADEIRQHYNQKKPVMEMKFEEGSGQKAYDESFNNNDGWLGGTSAVEATDPTWTTGKFGSGLSFDGGDWVDLGNKAGTSLDITNEITLEAWVYPQSTSGYRNIINNFDFVSYGTSKGYILQLVNGYFQIFLRNIGAKTDATPYLNKWVHVVGTYDGTNSRLYLNGVLKSTVALSTPLSQTAYNFAIGKSIEANGEYWSGSIDEVRVYNYARTAQEILVDYNNGVAGHLR